MALAFSFLLLSWLLLGSERTSGALEEVEKSVFSFFPERKSLVLCLARRVVDEATCFSASLCPGQFSNRVKYWERWGNLAIGKGKNLIPFVEPSMPNHSTKAALLFQFSRFSLYYWIATEFSVPQLTQGWQGTFWVFSRCPCSRGDSRRGLSALRIISSGLSFTYKQTCEVFVERLLKPSSTWMLPGLPTVPCWHRGRGFLCPVWFSSSASILWLNCLPF